MTTDRDLGLQHSLRFRKVSNRYPRQVADAYHGNLAQAAADTDQAVATTVAAWEQAHKLTSRDWPLIGKTEK